MLQILIIRFEKVFTFMLGVPKKSIVCVILFVNISFYEWVFEICAIWAYVCSYFLCIYDYLFLCDRAYWYISKLKKKTVKIRKKFVSLPISQKILWKYGKNCDLPISFIKGHFFLNLVLLDLILWILFLVTCSLG